MVAAVLPVALLAVAIDVAADRNDRAAETVGQDATRGITLAQSLKRNLAELDQLAVAALLEPTTLQVGAYPQTYNSKRDELHDNLVTAAADIPEGVAYHQPLADIDYALGHYHALVGAAVDAAAAGDPATAATDYEQAHEVMVGTLLPAADAFDKANSYVLNDTYRRHKDDAAETVGLIVGGSVVLLGFLGAVQLFLARRFRRTVNLTLLAATILTAVYSAGVVGRMSAAQDNLTEAREQSFDSVHVLARARTTAVSALQAQGMYLLNQDDPEMAAAASEAFETEVDRLFRLQAGGRREVIEVADDTVLPRDAGGYLAIVTAADLPIRLREEAKDALRSFGEYLQADTELRDQSGEDRAAAIEAYGTSQAAEDLADAIDEAQAVNQAAFDADAEAAADATRHLRPVNLGVAVFLLGLILVGLMPRLREYSS